MTAEFDVNTPVLLRPRFQAFLRILAVVLIAGLLTRVWCLDQATTDRKSHEATVETDGTLVIDLNDATFQELMLMPGIGPKTARQILLDRRQHGPYDGIADLQRVAGVGPKTVQAIAPYCHATGRTPTQWVAEK